MTLRWRGDIGANAYGLSPSSLGRRDMSVVLSRSKFLLAAILERRSNLFSKNNLLSFGLLSFGLLSFGRQRVLAGHIAR